MASESENSIGGAATCLPTDNVDAAAKERTEDGCEDDDEADARSAGGIETGANEVASTTACTPTT